MSRFGRMSAREIVGGAVRYTFSVNPPKPRSLQESAPAPTPKHPESTRKSSDSAKS